jgi:hypothetical protein
MQKVVFTSEVCTCPRPVKGFVSKFRPRVSCPMSALSTQKCAESPHARLVRPPQGGGRARRACGDKDGSPILVPTIVLRADIQHVPAASGSPRAPLARQELLWIDGVLASSVLLRVLATSDLVCSPPPVSSVCRPPFSAFWFE